MIDESGNATTIDLAVAYGGGVGFDILPNAPNAGGIPTHTNSLTNINGVLVDETQLIFTFSSLTVGTAYEIYVFGGDAQSAPFSQVVSIIGELQLPQFTQSWNGNQFVNDKVGTNANLDTFALIVAPDAQGEIEIVVNESSSSDFAVIPALAN